MLTRESVSLLGDRRRVGDLHEMGHPRVSRAIEYLLAIAIETLVA